MLPVRSPTLAWPGSLQFRRNTVSAPVLQVRAWPLELVNATALDGASLVQKVDALRAEVAVDRFGGFDPGRFPRRRCRP